MKKQLPYILLFILAFSCLFCAFSSKAQQLKLGNNPTQIEKSAVLQLDSKNQGLLLSRISDTTDETGIDALDPPDGMIIYFTDAATPKHPNAGVYQRKDGYWERLKKDFILSGDAYGSNGVAFTTTADTVALHLPDASDTTSGIMNGGAQSFRGNKTFLGNVSSDSLLLAHKMMVKDSFTVEKLSNTESRAFLVTDKNGRVKLDTINDKIFWKIGGNDGSLSTLGTLNNRSLRFITDGETRMRITPEGKVGIGMINESDVTDTLTVNGSFRLGNAGSSFLAMVHDSVTTSISFSSGSNFIDKELAVHREILDNAHVIVNPREPLISGSDILVISWVKAEPPDKVLIRFYNPTGNAISISPITFDVYYINH